MTRRSAARTRPAGDAVPRIEVVQSDKEARTSAAFTARLQSATQEILAVTYWFDPAPHPGPILSRLGFLGAASM
jgi:hypothetical protein